MTVPAARLTTPADASTAQLPDTSRATAPFAVAIACAVVATLAILLRIIARRLTGLKLAAEDYTIFLALLGVYAMSICGLLQTLIGGSGHHVDTVFLGRVENLLKSLVVVQILFGVTMGLIKISICLFYIRIFETRTFRLMATGVMVFCAAWTVMCILVAFLICHPLSKNWDRRTPGGSCGNEQASWIATGATDILADVCVMLLPIPTILRLQMPLATKFALLVVFGLGLFTMVVSGVRINYLIHLSFEDITFTTPAAFCCSVVAPTVGLLVACAPMYRSLFRNISESSRSKRSEQNHKYPLPASREFNPLPDEIALAELGKDHRLRGEMILREDGPSAVRLDGIDPHIPYQSSKVQLK